MTRLDAKYVYVMDDDDTVLVGFADRQYETRRYVLMQRQKVAPANEMLSDQQEIHITIDDEQRACYGGVRLLEVELDEIRISLDESCASALHTDMELQIAFPAKQAQRAQLLDGLRGLVANTRTSLRYREVIISQE